MPRHENHAYLEAAAQQFGWTLQPGQDNTCECDTPAEESQIWMKPCAWEPTCMTPVGCYCCTDLGEALQAYYCEMYGVPLAEPGGSRYEVAQPEGEGRLSSEVPSFLPPYRPH